MTEFLELYSEAGMIGVVGAMFVFMVYTNAKRAEEQSKALGDLQIENRGQSETLENTQSMVIKLIERWNKSDDISERRRDDLMKEVNDMSDKISYLSGRMNGKSNG